MFLKYQIKPLQKISEKNLKEINNLLFQLDPTSTPVNSQLVKKVILFPGNSLFVAKSSKGGIIGMLTLAIYPMLIGSSKAWIEDVVVDQQYRRHGIGEALVKKAVEKAREEQIKTVNLTSRSSRKEAISLYIKTGFSRRETNCYCLKIK